MLRRQLSVVATPAALPTSAVLSAPRPCCRRLARLMDNASSSLTSWTPPRSRNDERQAGSAIFDRSGHFYPRLGPWPADVRPPLRDGRLGHGRMPRRHGAARLERPRGHGRRSEARQRARWGRPRRRGAAERAVWAPHGGSQGPQRRSRAWPAADGCRPTPPRHAPRPTTVAWGRTASRGGARWLAFPAAVAPLPAKRRWVLRCPPPGAAPAAVSTRGVAPTPRARGGVAHRRCGSRHQRRPQAHATERRPSSRCAAWAPPWSAAVPAPARASRGRRRCLRVAGAARMRVSHSRAFDRS